LTDRAIQREEEMDKRDGRIYTTEETVQIKNLIKLFPVRPLSDEFPNSISIPPTEKQIFRRPPRGGRNEPCPCGSGKKFKKCCLK